MKLFLITGLPRSRTFWFSQYFNQLSHVFCGHQLLNGCYSEKSFLSKLKKEGKKNNFIGDSDSMLPFLDFKKIPDEIPVLVIERDFEEVIFSMLEAGLTIDNLNYKVLKELNERIKKIKGLRIIFDVINDELEEIHSHLLPQVPFDQEIANEFIDTNLSRNKATQISTITYHRIVAPKLN